MLSVLRVVLKKKNPTNFSIYQKSPLLLREHMLNFNLNRQFFKVVLEALGLNVDSSFIFMFLLVHQGTS